jgi:signal transduction histidine kinase
VARAINDELGQQLTALKLDLSWSRKRLSSDSGLNDKMTSMIRLVEGAIETVQRVCLNLRPSILDNLGLAAAIDWLVADMARRSDIEISLEIDPAEPEIDPDLSVALFRLLQESLNNVIRHASASQVNVSLLVTDDQAELRIRDNGIGISEQAVSAADSIGLVGMQERARSFGGSVEIQGFAGVGTNVTAVLPLLWGEKP